MRFTHSPYWHSYIRYTHPPKPHSHPGHGTNVTPRVHTATTRRSGSRTRDSGAGGGRSNKERQRLQPLLSVARAPLFEVRRVRFTHSPYWHSYIRYTHPPKPHSHPGHGTNVTPRVHTATTRRSGSRTWDSGAGGGRSNKERQRLQPLASVARAPLFEVRRVRFTHSPYWHSYIRYTYTQTTCLFLSYICETINTCDFWIDIKQTTHFGVFVQLNMDAII